MSKDTINIKSNDISDELKEIQKSINLLSIAFVDIMTIKQNQSETNSSNDIILRDFDGSWHTTTTFNAEE
jgi:hypothetical protein